MSILDKKIIVVTHSGGFHADDVFACAALLLWAEKEGKNLEIRRTRDEKEIEKADIKVDIGMQSDPQRDMFDHHQKDGAGLRENGIPYASFGLVWKKYGEIISYGKVEAEIIDKKVVAPIDARDNGVSLTTPHFKGIMDYQVDEVIKTFRPTGNEKLSIDEAFAKVVDIAKSILEREIVWAKKVVEDTKRVESEIEKQGIPTILILEEQNQWEEIVAKYHKIFFVLEPHSGFGYKISVVDDLPPDHTTARIHFPESWRGKRNEELVAETGIPDSVFCHSGGYMAIAKSKEAAMEMAKKVLSNGS